MEYIFIFDEESRGWWLKIDTKEKLADYHEKTGAGRYDEALSMYLNEGHPHEILKKLSVEERIKKMRNIHFKRLQCAVMEAENGNCSILDGFRRLNLEIGIGQMRALEQYGAIYMNRAGGYTFGLQYKQFCRRKELVFPDFKEADIRVKRFNGGKHYYAYIGDMQIRNGGALKWDSFDEAYKMAFAVIG